MKAIVAVSPGQTVMKNIPRPIPGPGQVLIRSKACAICSTDLEIMQGDMRVPFPAVLGHEWSGQIKEVGSGVSKSILGWPCVAENIMPDGGEVGFEYPGAYGEYFLARASSIIRLPEDFPMEQAALVEPLAVVLRGLGKITQYELQRILIFGDGPLSILLQMVLHNHGADHVVVAGGRKTRLAIAKDIGAHETLNYHEYTPGNFEEKLREHSCGGYNCIIDMTNGRNSLNAAIRLAAPEGKILLLGNYPELQADFCWQTLLHKELHLCGSNASAGSWQDAVGLATTGGVDFKRIISHVYPAQQYRQAIATARDDPGAVKVILKWE